MGGNRKRTTGSAVAPGGTDVLWDAARIGWVLEPVVFALIVLALASYPSTKEPPVAREYAGGSLLSDIPCPSADRPMVGGREFFGVSDGRDNETVDR